MSRQDQIETTIAFLESRRDVLGDEVIDAALAPLRRELNPKNVNSTDRRKQVTVLFADLSNFTAMSETMDAEDVRNIVESLWARIDKVIIDHGGTIDKHIGDAVMALWGISQTREDDPERAVHAALGMQNALTEWRKEMQTAAPSVTEMDPPISIRIGINTGTVILGLVGTTGEFTAIGDTVNTASRLEAAAPLGNILISQSTFLHVRGLFELREREPLQVKGKAKTLSTYLVQGAKPHQFKLEQRGIEGVTTPMIGRADGFNFLQERFFEVLLENHPMFVMLHGDAGIGKSRLIYEFNSWMESQSWRTSYFKGRARHKTSRTAFGLLHDILANRFNIEENDSLAEIQTKLELGFFNEWEPDADIQKKTHYIAHLANYQLHQSRFVTDDVLSTDLWKEAAATYVVDFFKAVSFTEPTVFLIEDIHWADQESLDLLIRTVEEASSQILLIICTARQSSHTSTHNRLVNQPFYNPYEVEPLPDSETRELIDAILCNAEKIPPELYEMITSRAGGNPYHIEEFIKMMVNDKVILKDSQPWVIAPERLDCRKIPTTLASMLEARLDALPNGALEVIQFASSMDTIFWKEAIEYMSQNVGNESRNRSRSGSEPINNLEILVDKGLIRQQSVSRFPNTTEYIFTNALLKQVCYERILKRKRQLYRTLAAEWVKNQEDELSVEECSDVSNQTVQKPSHRAAAQDLKAAETNLEVTTSRPNTVLEKEASQQLSK